MRIIREQKRKKSAVIAAMAVLAVSAVAVLLPACSQRSAGPGELPDILLVTIDTLRADHSSAYGYGVPTMPVLERLARRGTLFERVYAPTATTSPSHAALLTGRYPRTLGVTKNGQRLRDNFTTLAEALGREGYQTAAFVSSIPLRARFGFDQGFQHYDDQFTVAGRSLGRPEGGRLDRRADHTTQAVAEWMAGRHDPRPLFVWVHYVDPHAPYQAPVAFAARWPDTASPRVQAYDGEVRFADSNLGRLVYVFERAAPKAGTLVVVTSDHGEGLGQHGWMYHGINLYEEAVRVPLVFSWPGKVAEGSRRTATAELTDVATTIFGLLGLNTPSPFDGRDLMSAYQPRPVYLERRRYRSSEVYGVPVAGPMHAVIDGDRKFIVAPDEGRRELYDLAADPHETRDLAAGTDPGRAETLAGMIAAWTRANPEARPTREVAADGLRRRLEALGYVD
ncbi:MAG: sulfatase [Deltaproteobacteria bacterium]